MEKIRKRINASSSEFIPPPPDAGMALSAWPIDIYVSPSNIPVTAPIDVDTFLNGDADVCQVVAKVPSGWSYNGWYFKEQAVQDMAESIAGNGITAGLGHISDMSADFGDIAVVWVGAQYVPEEKAMYARGYVNPDKPEVKRLIRSKVVNRVSPDGIAQGEIDDNGYLTIDNFNILSLDLVPRLRNGTESGIEARDMLKQESVCAGEVKDELDEANEKVVITEEVSEEKVEKEVAANDELGEIRDMLEALGENPAQRLADLLKLEAEILAKEAEAKLSQAISDMVAGEDAKELVSLMVKPMAGETDEQIKTRITDCLNDPKVKKILSSRFAAPAINGTAPPADTKPKLIY